jgi:general secretion pathway protein A
MPVPSAARKAPINTPKEIPVKPVAAEVALPTVLELPADLPRARSEQLAYAALFRVWGAKHEGPDACREAEEFALRCRSARGGLEELRQLNRPAVLLLHDSQGQPFNAALVALDDKGATFAFGDQSRTVALSALATQWAGQYTLLWRLPPGGVENILLGTRGPAVQWLIAQLARTRGEVAESAANALFDRNVERQVKQFQLAQGLAPDGQVGPQTVVRLAAAGDSSAPELQRRTGVR